MSDASYAMSHMISKNVRVLKENLWVKERRFRPNDLCVLVATDKTTFQDNAEGKELARGAKDRTRHYYTKKVLQEERNPNEEAVRVNTVSTNVPQRKSENQGILLQTILPVIVTQRGTSKSVITYAFYDKFWLFSHRKPKEPSGSSQHKDTASTWNNAWTEHS